MVVEQLMTSNANHALYTILGEDKVARLASSAMQTAGQFANAFQETLLDKGIYKPLLSFMSRADYAEKRVEVEFKATKNLGYKNLNLEFVYYVQQGPRGFNIEVPLLHLSAFAETEEEVEAAAAEVIRMDFIRNNKLEFVQGAIEALWFHGSNLVEQEVELTAYTMSELEQRTESGRKWLLPTVAQLLDFSSRPKMLFGYDQHAQRIGDILRGNYNRSILLVGKSGVGKTALLWEAVRRRRNLGFPQSVWETTASMLIKELTQNTGWQQGLTHICQELRDKGDALFVRNLLELFEVGQYEGNSMSMAVFMREFIARGEVTLISECTEEELARIDMRYPNFTTLFTIVRIEEPKDNLMDIIMQRVKQIADDKKITIDEEAIAETVRLQQRYTPYAGFPGKSIRFLESILVNAHHLSQLGLAAQLDKAAVIRAFCDETGMPEFMINPQVPMRLANVEEFFLRNVFGQNQAVRVLVDMLAAVKTTMLRQGKPIASMLFVGPTGVGKTEMAKVLAEFMFGSRDKMIRFDMSEFSDPYAIGRLIGEHYFADGLLTSAVRREPFCVLLFDELEKATPDFNDLLLQMLGEGRLSDSQGKVVNFCSTIIIMTSNIGAKKLQMNNIGWEHQIDNAEIADFFENEVRKHFRPEIYNRIDQIIPFYALDKPTIRKVVAREVLQLGQREGIFGRRLDWKCGDDVYDYLVDVGHHPQYGARALQRALREEMIIPLAKLLNEYPFDEKIVLHISIQDGQLALDIDSDPLKIDLMLEELTHHEFTDYASSLRHRIYRLTEGNAYMQFLSELKDLTTKQKKQARDFWNNARAPRQLAYFNSLKERIAKAIEDIDGMELDMAMISMNLRPLNTLLYDKIKSWEAEFNAIKLELLTLLNPELNTVTIGLYSKNPQPALQFYIDLCQALNYSWEAQTVWYRHSLYHEEIPADELEQQEQEDAESNYYVVHEPEEKGNKTEKAIRKAYFKKAYDPEKSEGHNFKLDKSDDILVGVEFLVMAQGARLYFQPEEGIHRFSTGSNDKNFHAVMVSILDPDFKTAPDLHRRFSVFQASKARRTYFHQELQDKTFEIEKRRALKNNDKDEQLAIIKSYLDTYFIRRVEATLNA